MIRHKEGKSCKPSGFVVPQSTRIATTGVIACDPPNAIFRHCFEFICIQVAVTHSISYEIPPKYLNGISKICT